MTERVAIPHILPCFMAGFVLEIGRYSLIGYANSLFIAQEIPVLR